MYLDWKSGEITKEEYRRLKGKIAEQIQQLEANISYLKEMCIRDRCAADVDELNFLAARLEQLDPAEVGKLNAALQKKNGLANVGQVLDFTYNVDFYVHIPEVHNYHDLGDYYLNQSGMVQMPEEWKGGI